MLKVEELLNTVAILYCTVQIQEKVFFKAMVQKLDEIWQPYLVLPY